MISAAPPKSERQHVKGEVQRGYSTNAPRTLAGQGDGGLISQRKGTFGRASLEGLALGGEGWGRMDGRWMGVCALKGRVSSLHTQLRARNLEGISQLTVQRQRV